MKKIMIFSLILASCAVFSSCGDENSSESSSSQVSKSSVIQESFQSSVNELPDVELSENSVSDSSSQNEVIYDLQAQKIYMYINSIYGNKVLNGEALDDGSYSSVDNADIPIMQEAAEKLAEENITGDYSYVITISNKVITCIELFDEEGNSLGKYEAAALGG